LSSTTPPGSDLQVESFKSLLKVQAGQTGTVYMPVRSSSGIGTATVRLQLATQNGSPLTWTAQPMSVEVTRFGRMLLILIGGALGILVLTSVYRLRRKRLAGAGSGGSANENADAGGAG
jgi:tetrahydromethanopterin S-methyltransferase subunit D